MCCLHKNTDNGSKICLVKSPWDKAEHFSVPLVFKPLWCVSHTVKNSWNYWRICSLSPAGVNFHTSHDACRMSVFSCWTFAQYPPIFQCQMSRLQGFYRALVRLNRVQSQEIHSFGAVRHVIVQLFYLDFNVWSICLPLFYPFDIHNFYCVFFIEKHYIHFMTFWKCGINNSWNGATKI